MGVALRSRRSARGVKTGPGSKSQKQSPGESPRESAGSRWTLQEESSQSPESKNR